MSGANIEAGPRRARLLSDAQGPLLVGVVYYLGAEAAFLIGTLTDKIFAPFWPPNAILFCALALVPYRRWPHYIIAVVPAHIMAELSVGMGWLQMFVAFATNIMVALLNAFGLRYLLGPPPWLNSLQRAVGYVLITAVGGPGIAALGGAFVRITGGAEVGNYWQFWAEWYVANALASLTLGAMVLTWLSNDHNWAELRSRSRRHRGVAASGGSGGRLRHSLQGASPCQPELYPKLAVPAVAFRRLGSRTFSKHWRERGHIRNDSRFHRKHAPGLDSLRRSGCGGKCPRAAAFSHGGVNINVPVGSIDRRIAESRTDDGPPRPLCSGRAGRGAATRSETLA